MRPDAPVCRAFAMEGYCSKGLDCRDKHIHVCPEFAETGKCSNANCRLPHVARRAATGGQGTAGIIRPGTWVSASYWHEQRKLQADNNNNNKRTANRTLSNIPQPSNSSDSNNNMTTPRPTREEEEQQGFVRLFDDSEEDEGWSQYLSQDHAQEESSQLHFSDNDEDEEDENSSGGDSDSNMDEVDEEDEDEEVDEYEIAEDDGEYVEEEQVIAK